MAKRFIIMSVPTDTGAFWFVYDKNTRKSRECDSMKAAVELAKNANITNRMPA